MEKGREGFLSTTKATMRDNVGGRLTQWRLHPIPTQPIPSHPMSYLRWAEATLKSLWLGLSYGGLAWSGLASSVCIYFYLRVCSEL